MIVEETSQNVMLIMMQHFRLLTVLNTQAHTMSYVGSFCGEQAVGIRVPDTGVEPKDGGIPLIDRDIVEPELVQDVPQQR